MNKAKIKILASSLVVAGTVGGLFAAWASPATGVSFNLLARGTYPAFKVDADKHAYPIDFRAHAKQPLDIVVREHFYEPNGSTGWHTHPGPVFITVVQGELWFYEYDDPTCTPTMVRGPNGGYVDSGHGHLAVNPFNEPAKDVTVVIAPVGLPFRAELDGPPPSCPPGLL
jgi:hypothetical protein